MAGFNKWRDQFSLNVMRGEKGIKIIAPTPIKRKLRNEARPDTKARCGQRWQRHYGGKRIQIPMYRPVTCSMWHRQRASPSAACRQPDRNVQQYEVFMEALRRAYPVPMEVKPLSPDMDGYFSTKVRASPSGGHERGADGVCRYSRDHPRQTPQL